VVGMREGEEQWDLDLLSTQAPSPGVLVSRSSTLLGLGIRCKQRQVSRDNTGDPPFHDSAGTFLIDWNWSFVRT
jgi:hypothetical protein